MNTVIFERYQVRMASSNGRIRSENILDLARLGIINNNGSNGATFAIALPSLCISSNDNPDILYIVRFPLIPAFLYFRELTNMKDTQSIQDHCRIDVRELLGKILKTISSYPSVDHFHVAEHLPRYLQGTKHFAGPANSTNSCI